MEALVTVTVLTLLTLVAHTCSSQYQDGTSQNTVKQEGQDSIPHRLNLGLHQLRSANEANEVGTPKGGPEIGDTRIHNYLGKDLDRFDPTRFQGTPIMASLHAKRSESNDENSKEAFDSMLFDVESALNFLESSHMQSSAQAQEYPDKRLQRHRGGPRQHNFVRIGKRNPDNQQEAARDNGVIWSHRNVGGESSSGDSHRSNSGLAGLGALDVWKNPKQWPGILALRDWTDLTDRSPTLADLHAGQPTPFLQSTKREVRSSRRKRIRGHSFVRFGRSPSDFEHLAVTEMVSGEPFSSSPSYHHRHGLQQLNPFESEQQSFQQLRPNIFARKAYRGNDMLRV